ncbi:MAG: glycosyltransferase [Paludibacteraceae bacterium]|nr:glycosyltransferase [Paludibacteraceae bacterium]
MDNQIVLAIYCMVYNHEAFLRNCFEGFVMQKTNFRYVAVVHDDCSTDNSAAIIREYAEKYPDLFIPIFETENQYPKHDGSIERIMKKAIDATGCKYVAFCEGDDYWTDPAKLQKQVDFMGTHPEYSVTFHRCKHYNIDTGEIFEDDCGALFEKDARGVDVDVDMFFSHWYTQPLTMVYRADGWILEEMLQYRYYRDMHQIYHLLKRGKGYVFSFFGGVRTVHSGGVASQRTNVQQCEDAIIIAEELYRHNRDFEVKKYYAQILQWAIDLSRKYGYNSRGYIWQLFRLNHDFKKLVKNLLK